MGEVMGVSGSCALPSRRPSLELASGTLAAARLPARWSYPEEGWSVGARRHHLIPAGVLSAFRALDLPTLPGPGFVEPSPSPGGL